MQLVDLKNNFETCTYECRRVVALGLVSVVRYAGKDSSRIHHPPLGCLPWHGDASFVDVEVETHRVLNGTRGVEAAMKDHLGDAMISIVSSRVDDLRSRLVIAISTGTRVARVLCCRLPTPEVCSKESPRDVRKVAEVLGIEAARASLLYQLHDAINYIGAPTTNRPIGTLCDAMTRTGVPCGVTRHGMATASPDAMWRRASFERSLGVFTKNAARSIDGDEATHNVRSTVTGSIIFGTPVPIGSGFCNTVDTFKPPEEISVDNDFAELPLSPDNTPEITMSPQILVPPDFAMSPDYTPGSPPGSPDYVALSP